MGAPVFISYSSKDRKVAGTLCKALEGRGVGCWFAGRDVPLGGNYQEHIFEAITKARVMVLVFSSHARDSDEILKELSLASAQKLVVIPVRTEDVAPTGAFAFELATRQWIDLFHDWEEQIGTLARQIHQIIGGEGPGDVTREHEHWWSRPWVRMAAGGVAVVLLAGIGFGVWRTPPSPVPSPSKPVHVATDGNAVVRETLARQLRKQFLEARAVLEKTGKADFSKAESTIEALSDLDHEHDGHVWYYKGEIKRLTNSAMFNAKGCLVAVPSGITSLETYEQDFYRYMEEQFAAPAGAIPTTWDADSCYTSIGFCPQRTAWIYHLLANDFYRLAATDPAMRDTRLRRAIEFLTQANKYPRPEGGVGFDQCVDSAKLNDVYVKEVKSLARSR